MPDTFFQRYNTTCDTKGEPSNEQILQIFLHGWGLLTGKAEGVKSGGGSLCDEMDFMPTFETTTKCNSTL